MKKLFLLIIIILIGKLLIPKYNELNNITIIDKITITCNKNKYNIIMREKYITKDKNNLKYKYKYHKIKKEKLNNINNIYINKNHKTFYLNKAKKINKCKKNKE